ncbi:hypothetical protein HMPREF3033_01048 [Veillonellaceae bacterium DNF00751]|nr:hypothetical protein HMPREF3033_01048 [Veillonellaceae bacterium DNF00751]
MPSDRFPFINCNKKARLYCPADKRACLWRMFAYFITSQCI